MNIDTQEVAQFNQLADRWWDREGPFKTLHVINPVRMQFIDEQVRLAGLSVLDIGCGGGILSEALAYRGAHVTGIDPAAQSIEIAKLHSIASQLSIEYLCTTVEEFHPAHSFDVITCLEMLEHVPDPLSIIQSCADLIKPSGDLFLSTLNRNPKAYLFAIMGAEYLLKLLPKGTHDYAKFIKPSELAEWLRLSGFEIQQMRGLSYHPFKHTSRLTDDVSINYLVHAKRI